MRTLGFDYDKKKGCSLLSRKKMSSGEKDEENDVTDDEELSVKDDSFHGFKESESAPPSPLSIPVNVPESESKRNSTFTPPNAACRPCLPSISPNRQGQNDQALEGTSWGRLLYVGVFLAVTVAVAVAYSYGLPNFGGKKPVLVSSTQFREKLTLLREKYPNQKQSTWASLFVGFSNLEDSSPAVYLLLHRNEKERAENFTRDVFRAMCSLDEPPVHLFSSQQEMDCEVTCFKNEIESNIFIKVEDFEKFPGNLVKHFHFLCDVDNPMVKKAVYFFIMHSPETETKRGYRATSTMTRLWKDSMGDHELEPFIARLINLVIDFV